MKATNKTLPFIHGSFPLSLLFFFALLFIASCKDDPIVPKNNDPIIEDEIVFIDQPCSSCDFIITKDSPWYFDGIEEGVQPGDTIGMQGGDRPGIQFRNIIGTAENPVVIMNCDGKTVITNTTGNALQFIGSKYFHLTGSGDIASPYGFQLFSEATGTNSLIINDLSTNFEVDHIEVLKAGYVGIMAKSDGECDGSISRSTFTQYNTVIHHNYIHDTGGEGFYIGSSFWEKGYSNNPSCSGTTIWEPELDGVRIYGNIVERTGRDGIQVGSASNDCKIYGNIVRDYGLAREEGHLSGIQMSSGTTGDCNNNLLIDGIGAAIAVFGRGDNTIFNNVIINPERDGFATYARNPTPGLGFYIINNTVINPGGDGVVIFDNETVGTVFYNNIIVNPGGEYFSIETDNVDLVESNNITTLDISELMFTDVSGNDFSLKTGSSAINQGKDVSSYGIDYDFLKADRPVGAYDAGAYEHQN